MIFWGMYQVTIELSQKVGSGWPIRFGKKSIRDQADHGQVNDLFQESMGGLDYLSFPKPVLFLEVCKAWKLSETIWTPPNLGSQI